VRRSGPLLLVLLCVVGLAACSGDDASTTSSTTRASTRKDASLRGTNWALTDQASLGVPLGGVPVSAVFDATQVTGTDGCNRYFAAYTVRGATMNIGPLGSTLIGCTGAAAAVESAYTARLTSVDAFAIDRATLTLSSRGVAVLVYRAEDGADALAGGWNATGVYTGDAIESTAPGSTPTLEFVDTRVSGNAGCNTFSGDYVLSGHDGIEIGPLASTRKACADPAVTRTEQQYLAALDLATTYRVTGDQLTLFRPGGTIAATFQRATGSTSGS
jgi:heat shock protein HslJ